MVSITSDPPNIDDPGTIKIDVEVPEEYQIYQPLAGGNKVELSGRLVYEIIPPGQVWLTVSTGDWPSLISPEIIAVSGTSTEHFDIIVDPGDFNGTQSRTLTVDGEYTAEDGNIPTPIRVEDFTDTLTVFINENIHQHGRDTDVDNYPANRTGWDITIAMIVIPSLVVGTLVGLLVYLHIRKKERKRKEGIRMSGENGLAAVEELE